MAKHRLTAIREAAVKYVYQCEMENMWFFSSGHFQTYCEQDEVDEKLISKVAELSQGVLTHVAEIDKKLSSLSTNWTLERMAATDRAVLRVAAYEILWAEVPSKVVIDEAVECAKTYGTELSGSFVNGILDSLVKKR